MSLAWPIRCSAFYTFVLIVCDVAVLNSPERRAEVPAGAAARRKAMDGEEPHRENTRVRGARFGRELNAVGLEVGVQECMWSQRCM